MRLTRIKFLTVLLLTSRELHITMKTLSLKYLIFGCAALVLFDKKEMFESDHVKDLDRMNRNKGTNLRKTIERY